MGAVLSKIGSVNCAGVFIGIAGGMAEIVWIAFISVFGGTAPAAASRGIAVVFSPGLAVSDIGPLSGLAIHFILAITLGVALVNSWFVLGRYGIPQKLLGSYFIVVLAAVWAVNFLILLPVISPDLSFCGPHRSGHGRGRRDY